MDQLRMILRRVKAEGRELWRYVDPSEVGNEVERVTDFTHCERPVLLLPGFMASRRALTVLERRLRRDGYGVFSLNLGGFLGTFNTHSIEESALLVREKVERLYQRYNQLGPLTIIGHSKGGLIGRYYLKRLGGHERCAGLITLGTPHHGTPIAYVGAAVTGLIAPSIWQLMPMSPFIRRLKEGDFPAHVQFASIYSRSDKIVPFPAGMIEAYDRKNLVNIEVPAVSHGDLLTRKRVYELIREQLEKSYARRLTVVPSAASRTKAG